MLRRDRRRRRCRRSEFVAEVVDDDDDDASFIAFLRREDRFTSLFEDLNGPTVVVADVVADVVVVVVVSVVSVVAKSDEAIKIVVDFLRARGEPLNGDEARGEPRGDEL